MKVFVIAEDDADLPEYGSSGAAGADVRAYIQENIIILPGESALIPTGLKMAIPEGFEIQIRPRSGLALNSQITVLNTPGTIDSDYRGEVKVILINHGKNPFVVTPKMRIAQMVLAPFVQASYLLQEELVETGRGHQGFGHTGTH